MKRRKGQELERRTGMESDWEDDENRNEEKKGKEIGEKDGNLDWKEERK